MNGTVYGQQQAKDWGSFRDAGLAAACAGFDRLQQQYDVVICEGAGSPGEINLKATDIVNMGFVRERDMPVLLVGDIDRGGIYANFIGHYTVFDEWEKQRLRGYIVNQFRGDASLLSSAHEYVYAHTHKAVVGVVPFIANIGIPDEDRIVLSRSNQAPSRNDLDIAIIHLRHLANFSDIEPFTVEPGVQLRLVHEAAELGHPDAIIIPGSKSTIADCEALHANGLAQAIVTLRGQCEIVGICGGYQMLGSQIRDHGGVESQQQQCRGLDLLSMTTSFAANKHTGRSQALHRNSGLALTGFEIHHGNTEPTAALDPMVQVNDRIIGYGDSQQRTWGCYLHGCFDQDVFRHWWLNRLRQQRGINPSTSGGQWDLEPALNRVAKVFSGKR